ncbi:MAG: response regulator [Thermincolia bacterium]
MQEQKFFIIDDDRACRRMLANIIEQEGLGEVVGELETGEMADLEVMQANPDVVLVDLLLPGQDGLEVVGNLKERGYQGAMVMISQVENKDMVAGAYQAGIDFYIHKPINRVEVVAVLQRVLASQRLTHSLNQVRRSLDFLGGEGARSVNNDDKSPEQAQRNLRRVIRDLGLAGDLGSRELTWMVDILIQWDREGKRPDGVQLKEVYQAIGQRYKRELGQEVDLGTIEQAPPVRERVPCCGVLTSWRRFLPGNWKLTGSN